MKNLILLINKNKTEKIDFINTLLKLKGIKIEEDNLYGKIINEENAKLSSEIKNKNNNIADGQSNISTNNTKLNSENKLINNNDSLSDKNVIINPFIINNKNNDSLNKSFNDNKSMTLNVRINNSKININDSKRLLRFCSSMIKHKIKSKIYNSSKISKKINKNKTDNGLKDEKFKNYFNIFNKIIIQNNNIMLNIINENSKTIIPNQNNEHYKSLYQNKSDLKWKISIDNKKNNLNSKYNNSLSNYKRTKICFQEEIPNKNKYYYNNNSNCKYNSALYKNKSKSIIPFEKSKIKKNQNLSNFSKKEINKIEKKKHIKSYPQSKNISRKDFKYNNLIKTIISNPTNKINRKILNIKHKNLYIKKKFYNKEKIKNEQGLFTNKSNTSSSDTDPENRETFRLNLKKLKKIINKKKNELLKNSKTNKNIYESIIKNDKIYKEQLIHNVNNINLNTYTNKERRKNENICEIQNNIDNEDFMIKSKKDIILGIEINKRCFSKRYKNNSDIYNIK